MPTRESSRQKAKDEKLQAHRISDTEYVVYNPTSHSKYGVFKSIVTGDWYCTCPFAQKSNRVSKDNPCKHLARVLDKEARCACGNAGTLIDGKCPGCRLLDKMGFE